ncbi:hypothetical protein [Aquimarina sp. MMG016]|uniref:hypothetical protein n=1 Tax=Aquimarina sp. MMG016 TaxID=2822690 RepID=UPI001B39EE3B|nr:hypothetical protein [Aquimarina sp. MMG016]MBQ4819931.1 hypothetical protein [Aquimarina sp. MMG016]
MRNIFILLLFYCFSSNNIIAQQNSLEKENRLYHNVRIDEIRKSLADLRIEVPFKDDSEFLKNVDQLQYPLERNNIGEYRDVLISIMHKTEIPASFEEKYNTMYLNELKNIRHLIAHSVGDIYFNEENYGQAIPYYTLAERHFIYQSLGGTNITKDWQRLRGDIAECYKALKNHEMAALYFLSILANGQHFTDYANAQLSKLIEEQENPKKLKKYIDEIIESANITSIGVFSLTFQTEIEFSLFFNVTSEKIKQRIRSSEFYQKF